MRAPSQATCIAQPTTDAVTACASQPRSYPVSSSAHPQAPMLRCAACATRSVDKLVGRGRLFKRAIILIKAWCYNESRILGSHHGLIAECSTPSFSRTRRTTNWGSIDAARPAVLTHARTRALVTIAHTRAQSACASARSAAFTVIRGYALRGTKLRLAVVHRRLSAARRGTDVWPHCHLLRPSAGCSSQRR